jgi:hypothetical protein
MPKKEITNYVIYKIICNDENIKDCYVGSTSNFKVRKWDHKRLSNDENSKFKIYETIYFGIIFIKVLQSFPVIINISSQTSLLSFISYIELEELNKLEELEELNEMNKLIFIKSFHLSYFVN